jgi:hypothetical protein
MECIHIVEKGFCMMALTLFTTLLVLTCVYKLLNKYWWSLKNIQFCYSCGAIH